MTGFTACDSSKARKQEREKQVRESLQRHMEELRQGCHKADTDPEPRRRKAGRRGRGTKWGAQE